MLTWCGVANWVYSHVIEFQIAELRLMSFFCTSLISSFCDFDDTSQKINAFVHPK